MRAPSIALLSVAILCVAAGCSSTGNQRSERLRGAGVAATQRPTVHPYVYSLRAGGDRSFVGLTNAASANRVVLGLLRSSNEEGVVFGVTNREPHSVLVWNVRVQNRVVGPGTDGFGWETVADDYPVSTSRSSAAKLAPGASGELRVVHPGQVPWRVCLLYSIDWSDGGKSASGNYEAVGAEIPE